MFLSHPTRDLKSHYVEFSPLNQLPNSSVIFIMFLYIFLSHTCYKNGIIEYVTFPLLLSTVLRHIHGTVRIAASFLLYC